MTFLNNNNKNNNEKNNKNGDEDDIELTKEEIENNFYVQGTKETFDDLLLGNEEDDDEIKMLNDEDDENKNNFFGGNAGHKKKREGKDDIENFLINSGFYNRPIVKGQNEKEKRRAEQEMKKKQEEDKFIEKNRDKIFSKLYDKDLNAETLLDVFEEQNDVDMEVIKQFMDDLFTSLVKNKENTAYIIRAICTIISKLLEIKFPDISNNQRISFISEFLFTNLIIPILFYPDFNGIMMYNFENEREVSNLRCSKIIIITKVIKKLLTGELYDSNKKKRRRLYYF